MLVKESKTRCELADCQPGRKPRFWNRAMRTGYGHRPVKAILVDKLVFGHFLLLLPLSYYQEIEVVFHIGR